MLSEVFWVSFVGAVSALCVKLAAYCYKSKCRSIDFCGIHIERNVLAEADLDNLQAQRIQRTTSNVSL